MALFNKERKLALLGIHVSGINIFKEGENITANINEGEITFNRLGDEKQLIHLKLEKINNAMIMTEKEVIEKSKSVIGRAIVGSLLGPLGAVIGGISGVGNKTKTKEHRVLIINYDNDKSIVILEDWMGLNFDKFAKKINESIPCQNNIEL